MQSKPKEINNDLDYYNLDLLDPLPRELLQVIANEKDQQPAQRDIDNVNEFRKLYDDSWAYRYRPLTGKKKIPATKPYVEMLLLLDQLKKDAKRLMFNKYQGYAEEMSNELYRLSFVTAQEQLYQVLRHVYEQNEYDGARTKERIVNMLNELANPKSQYAHAFQYIPPLKFIP